MPPLWPVEKRSISLQALPWQPAPAHWQRQPFAQLLRVWKDFLRPIDSCAGCRDFQLSEEKETLKQDSLISRAWAKARGAKAPPERRRGRQGREAARGLAAPSVPAANRASRPVRREAPFPAASANGAQAPAPSAPTCAFALQQADPLQRRRRASSGHLQHRPSQPCSSLQPTSNPNSSLQTQPSQSNLAMPQPDTLHTSRSRSIKACFDAAD